MCGVRTEQLPPRTTPDARDRALRRVRRTAWGVAAGAAGLTVGLSAVAAHAFKGHQRAASVRAAPPAAPPPPLAPLPVHVPGPQAVPSIAGAPAPLQPPAQPPAPAPAPAAPAPAPQVSGGS
jgi:hypothetical protein